MRSNSATLVVAALALVGGAAAFAPSSSLRSSSVRSSFSIAAPNDRNNNNRYHQHHRVASTRAYLTVKEQEFEYLERASTSPPTSNPDVVYIIMYNPQTPQEGIHTMNLSDDPSNDSDLLLAFESIDDCVSFAETIRNDASVNFGEPVPTPSSMAQIDAVCAGMGLPMRIVPASA